MSLVQNYLLFVDTETSGLPKKWNEPYSVPDNWPYVVQLAWVICTNSGTTLKTENHYINNNDFKISSSSKRIHGITRKYLTANGISRVEALQLLQADIAAYQPLIVGHFMEFDYHMVGVEAYRAGLPHPLNSQPTFCTMIATKNLVQNPNKKYMRLGDLYGMLFNETLAQEHNALIDAQATAACFFQLVKNGVVTDAIIAGQKDTKENNTTTYTRQGKAVPFILIVVLFTVIIYYLWKIGFNF